MARAKEEGRYQPVRGSATWGVWKILSLGEDVASWHQPNVGGVHPYSVASRDGVHGKISE